MKSVTVGMGVVHWTGKMWLGFEEVAQSVASAAACGFFGGNFAYIAGQGASVMDRTEKPRCDRLPTSDLA
jgi:hypothetical protein